MNFTDVVAALQKEESFDLPLLEVLSGQGRSVLTVQLHRISNTTKTNTGGCRIVD